jgi:hypothetical protein
VDLAYRSPFEGAPDLLFHHVDDELCLWTYQGIAVAMVPPLAGWTAGLRNWYAARRDANLMGLCPLCGTEMPAFVTGTVHGEMRHENDCAIISPEWWAEYARQLAANQIRWVEA